MAASLLASCNLNDPQLPHVVFLREDAGVDGSFIISSVLGQRLKQQNTGTILLCLQNTFQHYANAGIRLGYNLNACRDRGALIALEPNVDVATKLLDSVYLHGHPDDILDTLWTQIDQAIENFAATKQTVTLIIDNLSWLLDVGIDDRMLCVWCRKLTQHANEKLSVVLKINTCHLYETLCNNLEDIADVEVQIVKLKSGNFKEVDGRLVCLKRDAELPWQKLEKNWLYKVNDRNVKVFVPGEVGAKA